MIGMPSLRAIRLAIFFILGALSAGTSSAAETPDARILFINSYHRGYSWSDGIEDGLREQLNASGKKIELSIEYLDSRRFSYGAQIEPLAQAMAVKYASYRPDLIVVSDNAAFDFAIQHRARLFPKQPIVFCGYNNFRPEIIRNIANITGVNEEIAIEDTVAMALQVHPKTRTLAFVLSTADASSKRVSEIAELTVFPILRKRFGIVVLKDASLAEIRQRLAELPADSLLFLSGQARDQGVGRALSPAENGNLISAVSPFPAYTFWDFHLNQGAIGGHIITGPEQGRKVAEIALRIINGEQASSIPVVMTTPTRDIFDYKVMKRFGIGKDDLPPGATMINSPVSLWENYRWQIVGILSLLTLETLLIGLLLHIARERRMAMAALSKAKEAAEVANVAKNAFLANMSHEMRTPLNHALGMAQLLRHETLTAKQSERVAKLETACQQLTRMIETVLELTRLEANHLVLTEQVFDSEALIDEVIGSFQAEAESKKLGIFKELAILPRGLLGNVPYVRMALSNYLSNAIRFTSAGHVTIRCRAQEASAEAVLLRFEVEDTGSGIAPADQKRLFNMFEQLDNSATRQFGGLGVGLAMTRKLARIMGGDAGCESSLGKGSCFWFTARLKVAAPGSA